MRFENRYAPFVTVGLKKTYRGMLSDIVDVSLEVPLGSHVVGALLGRLGIGLQEEIPHLLLIHLVEPIINTVCIHASVKIVRVRANVIGVGPLEIGVVSAEVGVVIDVDPVVAVADVIGPLCRRGVPPEIWVREAVIVDVWTYPAVVVARCGRHGVHPWSVRSRSAVLNRVL